MSELVLASRSPRVRSRHLEALGVRLAELRHEAGISRRVLADRAELSCSTVERIETGRGAAQQPGDHVPVALGDHARVEWMPTFSR